MRLGGFVIHGNNAVTLGRCLDSLAAVCDDLVAIDTGSTDGSAELAVARGFRVLRRPWEGYGAAREAAPPALHGCDWVFFLDSDEWLAEPARAAIRRLKAMPPAVPHVALSRRDWVDSPGGRFLYRREHHVRMVRLDHARWDRSMIVHEALPPARTVTVDAAIEHEFARDPEAMRQKVHEYALLWALRYHREGRRAKPAALQRAAHLFRELVLKRALLAGRVEALSIAAIISAYHVRKYEILEEIASGRHEDLVSLVVEGRLEELFRLVPDHAASMAAGRRETSRMSARRFWPTSEWLP